MVFTTVEVNTFKIQVEITTYGRSLLLFHPSRLHSCSSYFSNKSNIGVCSFILQEHFCWYVQFNILFQGNEKTDSTKTNGIAQTLEKIKKYTCYDLFFRCLVGNYNFRNKKVALADLQSGNSVSRIDIVCRYIFPASFVFFHGFYWVWYWDSGTLLSTFWIKGCITSSQWLWII